MTQQQVKDKIRKQQSFLVWARDKYKGDEHTRVLRNHSRSGDFPEDFYEDTYPPKHCPGG